MNGPLDMILRAERRGSGAAKAAERALDGWFLQLLARLTFAAVLFGYYWNSAMTKIGDGALGIFEITDGAYMQILPAVMEANGYDSSALAFFPWKVIVALGTYAEFVLPVLIVIGLFTRLAALGMLVFIVVQSYVDVAFHNVDSETIGTLFDRIPSATIVDQRALWAFLLVTLVVKGGGAISLDVLIGRLLGARKNPSSGRPVASPAE